MADSVFVSSLEAALLSLLFLCLAFAMLAIRCMARTEAVQLLTPAAAFSFSAAVWLAAAGPGKNYLNLPVFWDLLSLAAMFWLPVAVCDFVSSSFASEDSMAILAIVRRCHALFMLAAVIAVASNLLSIEHSLTAFVVLSFGSTSIIGYIAYRAILLGDGLAKLFAAGAVAAGICLGAERLAVKLGLALPLAWLPQWGILLWVGLMLAAIRRQVLQAEAKQRLLAQALATENLTLKKAYKASKMLTNQVAEAKQELAAQLRESSERLQAMEHRLSKDYDALQKTRERLIQTERLSRLGVMVAGLAHELNTPLGIGVTIASNLEKEIQELQELYQNGAMKKSDLERHMQISGESAAMIMANLRRAAELVKSFKTVATDQNVDKPRVFKLKEYLEQILLSLKPRTAKTPHSIKLSCSEDVSIEGHPGAFAQIITNLVINSLTHAFDQDQAGFISIEVFQDRDHIAIRFSDNGKGIPPDTLPSIFEPFFTTRSGDEGTGLGLYIVKAIMQERFNGTITCESRVGAGTTFYLRFPLRKEKEDVR